MIKRPLEQIQLQQVHGIVNSGEAYDDYVRGQNFVAKFPGERSLDYDFSYIYERINKDSFILDIGCRGGETVKSIQDKGYSNTYGLDIGTEAEVKCIENYGTEWTKKYFSIQDAQNKLDYTDKFDFIILSHVLEHFQDPVIAMRNICSILNDDGFIYIAVPSDIQNALDKGIEPEVMMQTEPGALFHWLFFESLEDTAEYLEQFGLTMIFGEDAHKKDDEYTLLVQKTGEPSLISDDSNFHTSPYLHWTTKQVFRPDFFNELLTTFPTEEYFDTEDVVMGNRLCLAPDQPKFWEHQEQHKVWQRFYNYYNQEAVMLSLLQQLRPQIELVGCNLDFDKITLDTNHTKEPTPGGLNDLFVYMDYNIAGNGYLREVHTDMNNRVLGFLFYLNEIDGTGGDLGIYSRSGQDITCEKVIKPQANLMAWKLDHGECWHNVSKMENSTIQRKFVYVVLTSKQVGVWKNKPVQWPNEEQVNIFKTLKF